MTLLEAVERIRSYHDRTLGHSPTNRIGYCAEPDGISAVYCETGILLAASPAPDPGAGLRDAAQAVVDSVHGVQYGTSTPRLPVTAESPVHWRVSGAAIDALRVALAPSAEPPETA